MSGGAVPSVVFNSATAILGQLEVLGKQFAALEKALDAEHDPAVYAVVPANLRQKVEHAAGDVGDAKAALQEFYDGYVAPAAGA